MDRLKCLLILCCLQAVNLSAQVRYKVELQPNSLTYVVSMLPEVTWVFPFNLTSSAQLTIRVPHAPAPYGFIVSDFQNLQPNTAWIDNVRINSPIEAPEWDYISFGLISNGTSGFTYQAGVELPIFSFSNAAISCAGNIEVIDNQTDPFLPPNSVSANIPNSLVTLGGGLMNAYIGNAGNVVIPCLPEPICTVFGAVNEVVLCTEEAYNGVVYENDTTLIKHYITFQGCDSIISTNITVLENDSTMLFRTICENSLYNGIFIENDTVIINTITNIQGCDSIIVHNIHTVPFYIETTDISLCEGDYYNGVQFVKDTMIATVFTAFGGCDSIIQLNIDVTDTLVTNIYEKVCKGSEFEGFIVNSDTILYDAYISAGGCDSIVKTHITALALPQPSVVSTPINCEYVLSVGNYVSYEWNNGANTPQLPVQDAGIYTVTVTDEDGCMGSASLNFQGSNSLTVKLKAQPPGCNGLGDGSLEFAEVTGGHQPYYFSIDGGQNFYQNVFFENMQPGHYDILVEDAYGCFWQDALNFPAQNTLEISGGESKTIHIGESVELNTNGIFQNFDSIYWSPSENVDCPNCLNTSALPTETTRYHISGIDTSGCIISDDILIVVENNLRIYIPNAFSPDGDGINDLFFVMAGPEIVAINSMKIFDRYGGLVYVSENMVPNDAGIGWNGQQRGKPATIGVYAYIVEIQTVTGAIEIIKGDFSLMR